MAKNGPYNILDFDNIFLLRPLKFNPNVGVCVVRENRSKELFVLKAFRKTDDEDDCSDQKDEYDFRKAFCTSDDQHSLVHLFACYQHRVSAHALLFCIRTKLSIYDVNIFVLKLKNLKFLIKSLTIPVAVLEN